eukprot:CAMPEP_0172588600 /NCGR_PEP_ID=MMETSP1068-20121228/7478_1 /TAXON_ID=35684 /ORGANISM="Pseudopedinella elastica, Strain CCMP716" /LENGTH=109 /DNA_ID=CAMNT_0013383971 /DNA_START=162 /DNA_END=488 /DNA_ORIENTATION=-
MELRHEEEEQEAAELELHETGSGRPSNYPAFSRATRPWERAKPPNRFVYRAALSVCEHAGLPAEARAILDRAVKSKAPKPKGRAGGANAAQAAEKKAEGKANEKGGGFD